MWTTASELAMMLGKWTLTHRTMECSESKDAVRLCGTLATRSCVSTTTKANFMKTRVGRRVVVHKTSECWWWARGLNSE